MTVVVILRGASSARERFHAYENRVARILHRHGGRIERRVVVEERSESFCEVHLVSFDTEGGLTRYQADPELVALAAERAACIQSTEILAGDDATPFAWGD